MTIVAGKVFDGAPGGIPLVAVERVGAIPRVAQFWVARYTDEWKKHERPPEVTRIAAYGPRDRFLGSIGMTVRKAASDDGAFLDDHRACMADLKAVAVETGVRADVVMRVESATLMESARGKGIGVALYIAAAAVAKRARMGIMADACFGSHTSDEARRVWGSRRLREKLVVHGLVGALRGPRPSLTTGSQRFASVSDNPEKWRLLTEKFARSRSRFKKSKPFKDFVLHWAPAGEDSDIAVVLDDRVVAWLFYGSWNGDDSSKYLEGAVEVDPNFRRQGLATAMYVWAEQLSGRKFRPATSHTDAAEAFWRQKKRPFGALR